MKVSWGQSQKILYQIIKRGLDLFVSISLLIFLSPLLILMAFAIVIDSPGGVFYRQQRVGKDGRPFYCYKFRSMKKDCGDANYKQYLQELIVSERNGSGKKMPYRKMGSDNRVTRVGRVIRRLYIDELPQLINILKGEMTLVGPRPHVQMEVDYYLPEQRRRLTKTPGVTGMWQVEGRANCTFNELIEMDLYYIDHQSLRLDMKILFETFSVLLHGGEASWKTISQKMQPLYMDGFAIPVTSGQGATGPPSMVPGESTDIENAS
jgi:lipopolysaccharide/colanic/teichoic acid biosynthesis glycosyltransferase